MGRTDKMDEVTKPTDDLETGNQWIDDYLLYRLYKVTSLLNMRLNKRLKSTGVNLSQWRVLSVLRAHGRLTLSQIIEHTLMEQPTVSRVVVQLEKDDMVSRHSSIEDSRIVQVLLTDKGAQTFDEIVPTAFRHQKMAFESLSGAELKALGKTLAAIERNIANAF